MRPGKWLLSASRGAEAFGSLILEVGAGETQDVTLVIGPGGKVSGRVVQDSGDRISAGTELRLAVPAEIQGFRAVTPQADGSFEWTSVLGGVLIRPTRLPDGFWLKAIRRGDADIIDTPTDVSHGAAVSDLTIVLSAGAAAVSGTVTTEGKPESDYTVILFPEAPPSRTGLDRLVRAERPDHTGAFRIAGIPPGAWLAVAVEYVEDGQWLDPAYLESLRPAATRVTLEPAEQKTLNLGLTKRGS